MGTSKYEWGERRSLKPSIYSGYYMSGYVLKTKDRRVIRAGLLGFLVTRLNVNKLERPRRAPAFARECF